VRLGFDELRLVSIATYIAIKCKLESSFITVIYVVSCKWLQCRSPFEWLATFYTFLPANPLFGFAFRISTNDNQLGIAKDTIILQERLLPAAWTRSLQ